MKKKKPNGIQTLSLFIFMSLLAVPLVIGYINSKMFKNKVLENPTMATGTITGFSSAYKRADALEFFFKHNEQIYTTITNSSGKGTDYETLYKYIKGKSFPVIFNKADPKKYSVLLVVPEDFEEYGLKYPDSLNWVLKYLNR